MHQIGEVAARVELSLRTVRYYEEMGLIVPERRTDGGFRLYTEDNIERLLLIKQMKPLGFSVSEMRKLLDAFDALRTLPARDARRSAAAKELAGFAEAAEERCGKLRKQLRVAEKLAKQLADESARERTI
jgi:DNA-binding transcriptional MerR regulator